MMRSKVIKKGISRCEIKGQRRNYYFFFPQVSVHSSEPSPQSWNVAINTHHPPSLNQHCHHHHRHHHHHHADLLCVACPPLRHTSASLARKLPCSAFRCCKFFFVFLSHFYIFICVFAYLCNQAFFNVWFQIYQTHLEASLINHTRKKGHHCLQKERIPFLRSVRKQNYTLVFSHI